MLSPSRHDISHETVINSSVDKVWRTLIDVDDWEWNLWTRLRRAEGRNVEAGTPGTLQASYEGDGKWEEFDFRFADVDEKDHVLAWEGSVGGGVLFSARHTMRLTAVDANTTRLTHTEQFHGLLPALGLGLPYKILDRNYLYMNKALKKKVESSS